MDTKMRENLQNLFEESAEKFGLRNIKYQSFSAQYGFAHKVRSYVFVSWQRVIFLSKRFAISKISCVSYIRGCGSVFFFFLAEGQKNKLAVFASTRANKKVM